MADHKDEIARIIANAEREAYARGVRDTIARFSATADELLQPDSPKAENGASTGPGRPSKALSAVRDAIYANPGMTGAEVARVVRSQDATIPERTARTCLRRLKAKKEIWQRDRKWYPKPNKKEPKNENGEAVGSPPH